jgi:SAM-dependent methyltransferase
MSEETQEKRSWDDYYKATSGRPPWPLLIDAASRFDSPGFAIDLGCGAGVESLELLARGWRVLAIDNQPKAIEQLLARVPSEFRDRLETQVMSFEEMELPKADLVWAGLSLSFCPPEHFGRAWAEVVDALKPGGRFAGDVFGDRHAPLIWSTNSEMTFLSADRVKDMLQHLEIEALVEKEEEARTAFQGIQHLHAFFVIARKPRTEFALKENGS